MNGLDSSYIYMIRIENIILVSINSSSFDNPIIIAIPKDRENNFNFLKCNL